MIASNQGPYIVLPLTGASHLATVTQLCRDRVVFSIGLRLHRTPKMSRRLVADYLLEENHDGTTHPSTIVLPLEERRWGCAMDARRTGFNSASFVHHLVDV